MLEPSFAYQHDYYDYGSISSISMGLSWFECWDGGDLEPPKKFKSTAEAWLAFIDKWVPRAVSAAN